MNLNNYRTTVVTLTTRLPFAFSWLVGDAEWAMGVVCGAHGAEWGEFFHRSRGPDRGGDREADGGLSHMEGHTPPTQPHTIGTARPTAAHPTAAAGHVRQSGSGQDDGRRCPAPQVLLLLPENRDHHHPPAPITRQSSDQGHPCTCSGTLRRRRATRPSGLHVLQPIHLHPPRTCHLTTQTAHCQRHADYGRSGTIESRHATKRPTRACVQTGSTTIPATTPRGHRDPGAPGITCQERSRDQPYEYGGSRHPTRVRPPGTAHPHMGTAPCPTGSPAPQPQTPPGASTRGRQPAANRAAATQGHPEPRPRHGTPDRPTEGPAYAPPEGPPTRTRTATPTDTTNTRASGTGPPHAHNPTESPNPQAPATSSAVALGDHLQAPAQAELASRRHHAPPAGPAVRPTEPSSPSRPAANPGPGPDPDPAHATVPADTPRSAGPGSLLGPPPVSEGHAREAARPTGDAVTPPAPPAQSQREDPTVDATVEIGGPPQRTELPPPAAGLSQTGKPTGG